MLPQFWKSHFLAYEFIFVLMLTLTFAIWAEYFNGLNDLEGFLNGNRGNIYGALASIFGSLLGFVITAVTVVIAFASDDRLAIIKESTQYQTLWKVFFAAIRALGAATLVALLALVFDHDSSPVYRLLYLILFVSLLSTVRIARCVWVLENIIEIVAARE